MGQRCVHFSSISFLPFPHPSLSSVSFSLVELRSLDHQLYLTLPA